MRDIHFPTRVVWVPCNILRVSGNAQAWISIHTRGRLDIAAPSQAGEATRPDARSLFRGVGRAFPPTDDPFYCETRQGDYTCSIAVSTGIGGAIRILGQSSKKGYNGREVP